MLCKFVTLSSLAALAAGHMMISEPFPYGADSLNNSPLDASGSDFPCKQRSGVYGAAAGTNSYAQGSTQPLKFKGSAVHGGGSCQISVTKDKEPTKDSVWKVIKSIEGGCPAQGQDGNYAADPNAATPGNYSFTIPNELASGDYTLAWTWFNKVGNREMYMNCAPVEITGSGGSDSFFNTLPDMFVANIGNGCGTVSDKDVTFPDPGKEVEKMNGATDAFASATAVGGGSCPQGGSGGGGNGGETGSPAQPTDPVSQPSNGQPSAPAPTTAKATAPAPSATAPSVPGGVFITVSQPDAAAPEPTTPTAPEPEQPSAEQPAPSSPTTSPGNDSDSGSGSGGFAAGTACTSEGEWNCVGGTSFQRCASGAWSALQAVASGSKCTPGQSSDLALAVKRGTYAMRRGLRFRG